MEHLLKWLKSMFYGEEKPEKVSVEAPNSDSEHTWEDSKKCKKHWEYNGVGTPPDNCNVCWEYHAIKMKR